MNATNCPTCDELQRQIDKWSRIDWRTWRDLSQQLVIHQTRDHCLHIATPQPAKVRKIAA